MFQHMCRIPVKRELIDRAMAIMDGREKLNPGEVLGLGRGTSWAGHEIHALVREGDGTDPVLMTFAVYAADGSLAAYANFTGYRTGTELRKNSIEFVISVVPED